MFFEPEISLGNTDSMLYALSGGDPVKMRTLRSDIPKREVYRSYYLSEVSKLNSLIQHVATMKNLKH